MQALPGVDGQGGEAEEGFACPIHSEVNQGSKGVASPAMVHARHHGAQMAIASILQQVAHCHDRGGKLHVWSRRAWVVFDHVNRQSGCCVLSAH